MGDGALRSRLVAALQLDGRDDEASQTQDERHANQDRQHGCDRVGGSVTGRSSREVVIHVRNGTEHQGRRCAHDGHDDHQGNDGANQAGAAAEDISHVSKTNGYAILGNYFTQHPLPLTMGLRRLSHAQQLEALHQALVDELGPGTKVQPALLKRVLYHGLGQISTASWQRTMEAMDELGMIQWLKGEAVVIAAPLSEQRSEAAPLHA